MKEHTQEPGPTVSGNDPDLKAIQERAEKAKGKLLSYTKGKKYGDADLFFQETRRHKLHFVTLPSELVPLFAHAREDIPMLLKALAEARGKLESIETEYKRHKFSEARRFMQLVGAILKGGSE